MRTVLVVMDEFIDDHVSVSYMHVHVMMEHC